MTTSSSKESGEFRSAEAFSRGDYASVALYGVLDDWRTFAARALIGCGAEAIEALASFSSAEARFYRAAGQWIQGQDSDATQGLQALASTHAHARSMLRLMRRPKIRVLSQCDRGSQWDLVSAIRQDSRFEVTNIGFDPNDKPNKPYADIRNYFDSGNPPDFYIAKMLEWHLLPPNLQLLPCPIFGHTADYDLHIQAIHPWLGVFDELLTTDHTEWKDVSQLTSRPVTVFPKAFSLGADLPPVPENTRPLDVFISGTTQHPYHPDKAKLLHQVLKQRDLRVRFLEGFFPMADYLKILSHTRAAFTYIRHPGGMPTRGMESIAMGTAIAVQRESILRAYLSEEEGLVTYSLESEDLPEVLRKISREWSTFSVRARRGAEKVRREFAPARTASQYFRFLTFLAAKPRAERQRVSADALRQKRSILCKGWAWRPSVNRAVRQKGIGYWVRDVEASPSPDPVLNAAREWVLEYATAASPEAAQSVFKNFNTRLTLDRSVLDSALELYRAGMERYPNCLVLRFNAIRTAMHFGEPHEVAQACRWASDTLDRPEASWEICPSHDVFPWDFFSQFFNYRRYFDRCVRQLQSVPEPESRSASNELAELILASIAYYLSHYPSDAQALSLVKSAVAWDPEFPFYKMRCAHLSLGCRSAVEDRAACDLLLQLAQTSMLHLPAATLLERLQKAGRVDHPQLAEVVSRAALTRERLQKASIGVDHWESVPLRPREHDVLSLPAISPLTGAPGLSGPASLEAKPKCKVLYLCLEFAQWQHARRLAYPAGLGLEEGLCANGLEVMTMPSICGLSSSARREWQEQVRRLCEGIRFDQVWVELVHSEWDPEFWDWVTGLAPVRVGLVMESLRYEPEVYAQAPHLLQRQAHVERRLSYVTHALCIDEADAAELTERRVIAATWWPQCVPSRFILAPPPLPPDRRAIFSGSIYGERNSFLQHRDLQSHLVFQLQPGEDATEYPALFDEAHRILDALLAGGVQITKEALQLHLETWRRIRTACFFLWIRGLQAGGSVVNLPSFVQGYAGRVFEAMAAGRPVVSWEVANRTRTVTLFKEGEEILLFKKGDPASLCSQLQRLEADPEFGERLAEHAQASLRAHHTVEVRVQQILHWVATGEPPDFSNSTTFTSTPGSPPRFVGPSVAASPEAAPKADLALGATAKNLHPLWLVLSRVQALQGDLDSGWYSLEQAVQLKPNDLPTQLARAAIAVKQGQWPIVREATEAVLRMDARHSGALRLLALSGRELDMQTLWRQAASLWRRSAPDELSSCVEVIRSRLCRQGDEALETSEGARSENRAEWKELIDRATLAWERAARPADEGALPSVTCLGNLSEARKRWESKDYAGAWNAAVEAILVRPFHPEGWLLLARVALAVQDIPQARLCADRVKSLVPKWKEGKVIGQSIPKKNATPTLNLPSLPEGLLPASRAARLTVCIITKNEERFIAQCIRSIKECAHQIVLLDTGSTDQTVALARDLGAEIYSFDWCDDFSAARNAALEPARGDWVLVLDADEEVTEEGREQLGRALREDSVLAWRLPLHDIGKEKQGCHYVPRLFRNLPGAFFKGRIHEHAFESFQNQQREWGLENRLGKVSLRHHGYTDEMVKDRGKLQRNLRLLERAMDEQPDDISLRMSYGLDLVRSGQLDSGLEEYRKAFDLMSRSPAGSVPPELRERLLTLMTTHCMTAQRFQSVVELSKSPAALATGPTASLHLMFGVACYVQRNHAEAAQHLKSCVAKRDQPSLSPIHTDIHTGGPRHMLAMCYVQLGKPSEAEREYQASLQDEPDATKVRFDFAKFLAQSGRRVPALEQLNEVVSKKPGELGVWRLGADISLDEPEFSEFAIDWTGEAMKHFPRDPTLGVSRAWAFLLLGKWAESFELWDRFHERSNPKHLAALLLCETMLGELRTSLEPGQEHTVSQEFCRWFRRLVGTGAEDAVKQLITRLPSLEPVLPTAVEALRAVLKAADAA